jgi:Zn-dependent M28 family amino/carboxypeptidase
MRRAVSSGVVGFGMLLASAPGAQAPPRGSSPDLTRIEARGLDAHLRFLADDLLEGRAPATRGGDLAARYIAAAFQAIGLEPGGDDGTFFQQVPILESRVTETITLTARAADRTESFAAPADLVAFSGTDQAMVKVDGALVFAGFGIVAPEYKWNDYAGLDVKGKVVLVMVNDPPATAGEPALFGGRSLTYYGRWTYKYEEAARQGAAGAILIHTTESASYPFSVVQSGWGGTQYSLPPASGVPALPFKAWMTEDASRRLAKLGGHDLDALRAAARSRGTRGVDLGVRVASGLVQQVSRKQSPNVIGRLAGSSRASESVVFTAHYDHLGVRPDAKGDGIYNGARDNASGVAGLIEVAEALASAAPPSRSVYFVATTAEESGLLGAEHLAARPPMAIDRVAANVNLDSLNVYGPAREIVLLGSDRSTLGALADRLAKQAGRTIAPDPTPERGAFFRSDHFPLAKAGVPALSVSLGDPASFHGPGAEEARRLAKAYNDVQYHQPGDEPQARWNLAGAVDDLRLLAELAWVVATSAEMPAYHAGEQFARPRHK